MLHDSFNKGQYMQELNRPFVMSAVHIFNSQDWSGSQTKCSEFVNIAKLNISDATSKNPLTLSLSIHELLHILML